MRMKMRMKMKIRGEKNLDQNNESLDKKNIEKQHNNRYMYLPDKENKNSFLNPHFLEGDKGKRGENVSRRREKGKLGGHL